jgi:hypothetical protein
LIFVEMALREPVSPEAPPPAPVEDVEEADDDEWEEFGGDVPVRSLSVFLRIDLVCFGGVERAPPDDIVFVVVDIAGGPMANETWGGVDV